MVDSYSISSEFGYDGLNVKKTERDKLPKSVDLLYDDIMAKAEEKSPFYAKCFRQLFSLSDNSVQVLFSESVQKRMVKFCDKESDREFLEFYQSLFNFVRETPQLADKQDEITLENLIKVFAEKLKPNDIGLLREKGRKIGHFPLYLALDRYFKNSEPLVREFALNTSYIYSSDAKKDRRATYLQGDSLKAFNKLRFQFGKFAPSVRRYFKNIDQVYKDLLFTEINVMEGTSFSQSFVNWVQWKYGGACFLGDSTSSYPTWCFSQRCVEMCFPKKDEQLEAFKSLYNHIVEKLSAPRDKNVVESLDNLLQFEEDSHAARMVYDEALDRYVSEKVPNIVRKVSPSKSVTEETKRLVRFIGHGLSIEGKNLIIPAGGAIALPIEKREPPKRTFDERRQEYEEKRKQREQAGKVVVEGSPIIERFITWAKSQDWFPTWATLYQKTFNEDPDSHLHSLVVAKALNNSIPGRGLYKVLYHFDFPFEVFEWNEKIKEAENGFITADRKAIVDKLADDVASAPDGFLLKTARQVFEEFGLDADHVTSGLYLLAESLEQDNIGYAPTDYKEYICLYKSSGKGANLIHSSWRWKDTYSAPLSLIKIVAQMAKATSLKDSDVKLMDEFLSGHKVDKNAKKYLLGCFIVYSKEGPSNYAYDFSNLRKDEKEEYFKVLEQFSRGNASRVSLLEKHKNRFL